MVIARCDLRLHLQMNDPDGNELWSRSTLGKCRPLIVKNRNQEWSTDGHDKLLFVRFEIY
jgi:hypothetical protein